MIDRILPASSFVAFEAVQVAHPTAVWEIDAKDARVDLARFAYFIPLPADPATASGSHRQVYLGERYGGAGLNHNGGGARCGLRDGVHIKGIGRNSLAGSTTPFWHSYGGENVANGIREAIWSEVIGMSLPFGSVRTLGVIDTATQVPAFAAEPDADSGATIRRGLTIREATLRPAHFMRAVYFSRSDQAAAGMTPDARRTAAAIAVLEQAFESLFGRREAGLDSASYLNASLFEMFRRFAFQLAAAQAKRIIHGTLNASNLCLDGKWIDYGTMTTVTDYGKIIVGAAPPDIWGNDRIQRIAFDFVIYLKKYLPPAAAADICRAGDLFAHFTRVYEERLELEFLKLTGIPEDRIAEAPPALRRRLYTAMRAIAARGNEEPFKLFHPCPNYVTAMPDRMGRFHLNTLVQLIAVSRDRGDAHRLLTSELDDTLLRTELTDAYFELREHYLARKTGDAGGTALFYTRMNAIRLNTTFVELQRHLLDAQIAALLRDGLEVKGFISALLAGARTLLAEPVQGEIDLSAWGAGDCLTCSESGARRNGVAADIETLLASFTAAAPPVCRLLRLQEGGQ